LISRPATLLLALLSAGPAQAWRAELLEISPPIFAVEQDGQERVFLRSEDGLWQLKLADGKPQLIRVSVEAERAAESDALADGKIAASVALDGVVYLAHPTSRYAHGVLGDAIEASSLILLRSDGKKEIVGAGADAVFEDLAPRLHDFDGDGIPEIVVVKSYLSRGSALAVIGRDRSGVLKVLAETLPIGTAHRWLNPAGFGDFTGSGEQEIAFVRMPHALGRLEIWRLDAGKLINIASTADASNHAIGSRVLGLAVAADFDGDGVLDLAIPSFDRWSIRLLRFRGGVSEIARIPLPARAERGLTMLQSGRQRLLVVGLENGRVALVRN
jgi:hypothetical protein